MTKELEALKRKTPLEMFKEIKELEVADSPLMTVEDFLPFMCKKVEQALTELKAIKEAKPSEALECLEKVKNYEVENHYKEGWNIILYEEMQEELDTIKQNLIKAEKLEKAIKCIKNLSAYNIELKEHVFVNKLIYWKDDLMLTGYSDNSHFKVEDYGITWKEVEE